MTTPTPTPQVGFCPPITSDLIALERKCDVKPYTNEQVKYNQILSSRAVHIDIEIPVTAPGNKKTLLQFPSKYYTSQLLFQDITFNNNTRTKYMLDFYQILRIYVFGYNNDNYRKSEENGQERYKFLLSSAQGGIDEGDSYTINPLKKSFKIRSLVIHIDFTSCQLPNPAVEQQNNQLPASTVFEDMNDVIHSPVRKNFNVVYEKIHDVKCSECDYEMTLCDVWKIEKQWCITRENNVAGNTFVQFNTGYFWYISVNNLSEPLRFLNYMNETSEQSRYPIGNEFAPEPDTFLIGPPAVNLELLNKYRWINLGINNAQALQRGFDDLTDEIRNLKRKLDE
jgi:hypothetical protein